MGQLGLGDQGTGVATSRSSPTQVGALATWSSVSVFSLNHMTSMALKTDSTMWTWGQNNSGQLGLGDVAYRSSPVQVGTLSVWSQVSQGYAFDTALKSDGTLWSWGGNGYGEVNPDKAQRSSPTQIGTLSTWASVSAGRAVVLAKKTDGTLWAWGNNAKRSGNIAPLGLGDTTARSSPVQIGTLATWTSVSTNGYHTLARKTDGTLWVWGNNKDNVGGGAGRGQLGLGDVNQRSSPVQVGTLTTWATATVGDYHSLAIKTDGTLWAWGRNKYGQVNPDKAYRSSPTQVGTLATWSSATGGTDVSAAIKTDGTLWVWGRGNFGRMGQGDLVYRSSPIQIGTLATWTSVSVANHILALHG